MKIEIQDDAAAVARAGASFIARSARAAVSARGRFLLAVSGGRTPWEMMRHLARESLPWDAVHLFQVDERVAPHGDPDRNLTHLTETLVSLAKIPPSNVHAMPVETEALEAAVQEYARELVAIAGSPPVLDLVHLGLGPDGHTASLVPNDPVLDVEDRDVAVTQPYQGHRRMTLTYPMINRARQILWLLDGAEKAPMLPRLDAGDLTIPAGRVSSARAVAIVDRAAASQ
jgi:6-phosphogluconolactonase